MRSSQEPIVIHGVNVQPALSHGAMVYEFQQQSAIAHTEFSDGLCFGFTASLMRELLRGNFSAVQYYKNPISEPLIAKAIAITNAAIDLARDGGDIESMAFPYRKIEKSLIAVNNIPSILDKKTNGALLIYNQRNGQSHQLLFFNKQADKCIVMDPGRFTIDNIDIEEGATLLKQIVSRSNPGTVLVVKDVGMKSKL